MKYPEQFADINTLEDLKRELRLENATDRLEGVVKDWHASTLDSHAILAVALHEATTIRDFDEGTTDVLVVTVGKPGIVRIGSYQLFFYRQEARPVGSELTHAWKYGKWLKGPGIFPCPWVRDSFGWMDLMSHASQEIEHFAERLAKGPNTLVQRQLAHALRVFHFARVRKAIPSVRVLEKTKNRYIDLELIPSCFPEARLSIAEGYGFGGATVAKLRLEVDRELQRRHREYVHTLKRQQR